VKIVASGMRHTTIELPHVREDSCGTSRVLHASNMRYVDGVDPVDVAYRELLLAASSARQKYNLHIEESKKKAEAEQSDKKRKAVSDRIEEHESILQQFE